MDKGIYVKDIIPNADLEGIFVTVNPSLGQSRNGPFWKLGLADATGLVDAKIWSPLSLEFDNIGAGILASVSGHSSLFRDQLQITLESFAPLNEEELAEVNLADFMPASPHDPEIMFATLKEACRQEFTHAPWRKLVFAVLNDAAIKKQFCAIPAAKSMHHAYASGLLEHTLSVFNLCRCICGLYPELDRQALLAGALFHDLGKIREFCGGLSNDYTTEGRLVGHILLGLEILQPFMDKSPLESGLKEHLKHLVLSHHGQHEYGAPCLPMTPEAFVLHYADNLDAKMNQFRGLFNAEDNAEGQWSGWQSSLNRRMFKPMRSPGAKPGKVQEKDGEQPQCLSLWKE